jgi:Lar family restriction alleviation protein
MKACPFCGTVDVAAADVTFEAVEEPPAFSVSCSGCDACGPIAPTKELAEAAWDRRGFDT